MGHLETGLAVGVGLGLGAGLVNATTKSKYKPGQHIERLPREAKMVTYQGVSYRFADGVYYRNVGRGYQVVRPPVGLVVRSVAPHSRRVIIRDRAYYVAEGVYYQRYGDDYVVVAEPVDSAQISTTVYDSTQGAEVAVEAYELGRQYSSLPAGVQAVTINGAQYFKFGELYFLPQSVDGGVKYLAVKLN
jgi:hypothetical protein